MLAVKGASAGVCSPDPGWNFEIAPGSGVHILADAPFSSSALRRGRPSGHRQAGRGGPSPSSNFFSSSARSRLRWLPFGIR